MYAIRSYYALTNVKDEELERIVKRQASPLYVSVHASDPETRIKMMLSKKAGRIKEQLEYLAKNKIIIVITSYSIHYTKLYDLNSVT